MMKTRCSLLALLFLAATTFAYAGGPPPMYVVVQKVVVEPDKRVPGWIQIWGHFTRVEPRAGKKEIDYENFSKPVYGYVYLSIKDFSDAKFQEELKDWQNAAGTGKAVAVGSCGDAGSMLKCPIHSGKETVTKPDDVYTTERLKLWGDMYANGQFNSYPQVAALLKHATAQKQ